MINENPQSLPVFSSPVLPAWYNKHAELRWKHRTHGGVNHVVIGKDLAGYFPKVLSTKGHVVLSRSNIIGNLIISGRMKTMLGEDSSTFNNPTIIRQVDPFLKMLSTDCELVTPIKRCTSCRGGTECKKTYLPDPARQEEEMALLKKNLQYCTLEKIQGCVHI